MKKITKSLCLLALLTALIAFGVANVAAKPTRPVKTATSPIAAKAYYQIMTTSNGKYYFVLKTSNGQTILSGYNYTSKDDVTAKIGEVKTQAAADANYDVRKEGTKNYFFIKGADGKAIGKSEFYKTANSLKSGLASVKKNAPTAEIKE